MTPVRIGTSYYVDDLANPLVLARIRREPHGVFGERLDPTTGAWIGYPAAFAYAYNGEPADEITEKQAQEIEQKLTGKEPAPG